MNFTFRAHERLSRAEDFARVRHKGVKRVGRCLVVWLYRRREDPPRATRLGIAVGRRHGGAVQRNLFKRRVRNIFRLEKHALARGYDIQIAPKSSGADPRFPRDYAALREDFLRLTATMRAGPQPRSSLES
jgi:ribonuclease P protein component